MSFGMWQGTNCRRLGVQDIVTRVPGSRLDNSLQTVVFELPSLFAGIYPDQVANNGQLLPVVSQVVLVIPNWLIHYWMHFNLFYPNLDGLLHLGTNNQPHLHF